VLLRARVHCTCVACTMPALTGVCVCRERERWSGAVNACVVCVQPVTHVAFSSSSRYLCSASEHFAKVSAWACACASGAVPSGCLVV
jgi:hypothetical protein